MIHGDRNVISLSVPLWTLCFRRAHIAIWQIVWCITHSTVRPVYYLDLISQGDEWSSICPICDRSNFTSRHSSWLCAVLLDEVLGGVKNRATLFYKMKLIWSASFVSQEKFLDICSRRGQHNPVVMTARNITTDWASINPQVALVHGPLLTWERYSVKPKDLPGSGRILSITLANRSRLDQEFGLRAYIRW